jgi:outer membrane protein assembly factor BamB
MPVPPIKQWLLRSAAFFALFLAPASLRAQPADSAILRGESPQTRKRLAEAEQKLVDEKAGEAVEELQHILDEAADDLVSVDGKQHRAARQIVQQILAKLPATALKSYQDRIDEPARKLLAAGQQNRDPKPLQQLLDRYFVSRSSEAALLLLGDLLFERGEFRSAELAWRRLLPDEDDAYPNPKTDAAAVKARIILAIHAQREPERARTELAAFEKQHAAASGPLAGRTGPYLETLKQILAKPQAAPSAHHRTWSTSGGDPGRTGALNGSLPVHWPTRPTWAEALPKQPGVFKSPPARPPFGHPVIVNGWAYVSDGFRVLGFELATGVQRTLFPIIDNGAGGSSACTSLSAANGRLYARVMLAAEQNKAGSTVLMCLNPNAKPVLREQWRLKPPEAEGRAAAVWEGSPLAADGKLWCAFSRVEGGRIVYGVACFDPADSDEAPERPAWLVEVCESPLPPGADQSRNRMELLALAGRNIVFNTNAGAVIAIDADTGHRAWAYQYPRSAKTRGGAESSPAVCSGGRVFIAPDDCDRVFALDATTGRELWESGPVENARIIGVVHNRVIISTEGFAKGLRGLGVQTGSHRKPDGWIQSAGLGWGQGLVSESAILWPGREGLWFLDPDSGDPIRTAPPLRTLATDPRGRMFGNLALADGWLVVVGVTEIRAYHSEEPPFVKPDVARNPFSKLNETEDALLKTARGSGAKSLRAWAAARLLTLNPESPEIAELRDEWLLTADGELVTYGTLIDRRDGKEPAERTAPGASWSPADRRLVDVPSLTADAEAETVLKLPAGSSPLRPIRGAMPAKQVYVASPGELLVVSVHDASKTSFARTDVFTHAADLPDGFVLAGPFAVAVYGAKREPVWVFRVPDADPVAAIAVQTEPLPPEELSSFVLAGEWLFARLGQRHLIAFDLKSHGVAWVLGTHGSPRYEPLMFDDAANFTPHVFVSERVLAVQLTSGVRWTIQASTGRVRKADSPTALVPWVSPPEALDGLAVAFADGPGLIRIEGSGKPRERIAFDGESSYAGEPPQIRRFGDMLFAVVKRNTGLELHRLDASTGKCEWREPAFLEAGSIDLSAADVDPQRIIVAAAGYVHAFNLDDGTLAWRVKLPAGIWSIRAARTVAIAVPAEAVPDEAPGWSRFQASFLREPQPWRLPWLAAALYDCWTERHVPVILLDLESGKRRATLTIPTRGPGVLPVFEGDTTLLATSDRIVRLK